MQNQDLNRAKAKPDLDSGYFVCNIETGEWSFSEVAPAEFSNAYSFLVSDFVKNSKEVVDWMAQLAEKKWFDPAKFMQFFVRLRSEQILRP